MFTHKDAALCIKNCFAYGQLGYGKLDSIKLGAMGFVKELNRERHARISNVARLFCGPMFVRPRCLQGARVFVDPLDTSHMAVFDEIVVHGVYDLAQVPFAPEVAVDCGGHIGLFTILASRRFPEARCIIFEPVPGNLECIRMTASRNGLSPEIRPEAVSDREGTATFHTRNSCAGSLGDAAPGVIESFSVNVTDLVKFLARYQVNGLLLKMDIEGEEENLLPKLLGIVPRNCAIFFETHRGDDGWNAVAGPLAQNGFEVKLLRQRDPYRDGFALRHMKNDINRGNS